MLLKLELLLLLAEKQLLLLQETHAHVIALQINALSVHVCLG